jgi:hypothetical protein
MLSYTLNVVKSISNYGLSLNGSTLDPCFSKGFLYGSPNISIVGNSCFIDYSNTKNISDLTYVKKLFANSPAGTTYTLSSGDYYDEIKNIRTDISGSFLKNQTANDETLIIGSIVTGFTYTTDYSYYSKDYFVSPPQYTTGFTGITYVNFIQNNLTSNPEKSFINAGFLGSSFGQEEYIQIYNSASNQGKLKVNSVLKLKDNKEILYTDTVLVSENLGSTAALCDFYLRGNADPDVLNLSRKTLGCYVVYDSEGNELECFENQNRLQAFLRSQQEPAGYSSYWVPCLDCSRLVDASINAATADLSLYFDNLVYFYVTEQQTPTFPNSTTSVSYVYTLYSNAAGNNNLQPTSSITFLANYGFKLDLSHPSLKQFAVEVYNDPEKNILTTQNLYKIGSPGFDQAAIIYQKTSTSPKVLYVNFSGQANFTVAITIV